MDLWCLLGGLQTLTIYILILSMKKKKTFLCLSYEKAKKKIVAFLEIGDILRFICYNNLLFSFSEKIDFWQNDIFEKLGGIYSYINLVK